MKIYLDDIRKAPSGWFQTYSACQTIFILQNHNIEEISLDHDLGDECIYGTGYEVLCWIEEQVYLHGMKSPIIHIHTDNPVARVRMQMVADKIQGV